MYGKHRKRRSEAQRRHDTHLHKSRRDPLAYTVISLEDMSQTVLEYQKRARKAEADAERTKGTFTTAEHQVGCLASWHKRIVCNSGMLVHSAQGEAVQNNIHGE